MRTWKFAEPGEVRAPLPVGVLWPMMAVELAHGGASRAAMLALMFHCLLRPREARRLCRSHVRLPGDLDGHVACGMVVIQNPKTAHAGGRVQHAMIADSTTLLLCRWA